MTFGSCAQECEADGREWPFEYSQITIDDEDSSADEDEDEDTNKDKGSDDVENRNDKDDDDEDDEDKGDKNNDDEDSEVDGVPASELPLPPIYEYADDWQPPRRDIRHWTAYQCLGVQAMDEQKVIKDAYHKLCREVS